MKIASSMHIFRGNNAKYGGKDDEKITKIN